jgi:hypothetical protein
MKRFAIAAGLALVLALGTAETADAQYIYGYNTVNPYTGTVYGRQMVITPFAAQSYNTYYNPWTGMTGQRVMYQNVWGTTLNRGYGYNPYWGTGYTSGYYYPGFGASPYTAGWYRFRW